MTKAVKIGIRALILSALIFLATWTVTSILDYNSPMMTTASQHQFSDNNQEYAKAHAIATSDPTAPVLFISGILYLLVWAGAGWQWWNLAQEQEKSPDA